VRAIISYFFVICKKSIFLQVGFLYGKICLSGKYPELSLTERKDE